MNILVIGNGFDLAHGLPTKYSNFLEFCLKIKITRTWSLGERLELFDINRFNQEYLKDNKQLLDPVKEYILEALKNRESSNKIIDELISNLEYNFWIWHFCNVRDNLTSKGKEGWIDFESEISKVVQVFERFRKHVLVQKKHVNEFDKDDRAVIESVLRRVDRNKNIGSIDDTDLYNCKKLLLDDLNKLIRCLEIYLEDCLGKMEIEYASEDIMDIRFDKILSFNYTDTYRNIYAPDESRIEYDFIHGKSDILNNIDTNNMVMGIDEYFTGKEEINNQTTFIAFKKYFQRIHKKTGCVYKEWISEMKKDTSQKHKLYIFGHSLDVTDKDVLRELINMENVYTTIFYLDKDVYASQIANLVTVIDRDNLISKVYGTDKKITFRQQKEPVKLKESQLVIKSDIFKLYNLHQLSTREASELINKVNCHIKDQNICYFGNQHNIISTYDALGSLGETVVEEDLLAIAGKISEKQPEDRYLKFNYEDWNNYDYEGEHVCNKMTRQFIDSLNENNRGRLAAENNSKFLEIVNSKDINGIKEILSLGYFINNSDVLTRVMEILMAKFNESEVETNQLWECIYSIMENTDERVFDKYIIEAKAKAKDTVLKSRLRHMQEVVLERDYYQHEYESQIEERFRDILNE